MKQKFFLSMTIAVMSLSASAQNEEKMIVNAGQVEHISIAKDMDIVLLPAAEGDRSMSLNANASRKLDLRFSDKSMTISALNGIGKGRLTVYLYVSNLKDITVENNTTVKTIGVLDSRKLDVFIEGEAKVHLKTAGKIQAHSLDDSEMQVTYLLDNLIVKQ